MTSKIVGDFGQVYRLLTLKNIVVGGGVPLDITCDTLLYSNSLRRRPKLSVALGESNKRRARNCLVATAKLDVERLFVTSLVLRTGTAGEPITLARTLVSL